MAESSLCNHESYRINLLLNVLSAYGKILGISHLQVVTMEHRFSFCFVQFIIEPHLRAEGAGQIHGIHLDVQGLQWIVIDWKGPFISFCIQVWKVLNLVIMFLHVTSDSPQTLPDKRTATDLATSFGFVRD